MEVSAISGVIEGRDGQRRKEERKGKQIVRQEGWGKDKKEAIDVKKRRKEPRGEGERKTRVTKGQFQEVMEWR